MQSAHYKKISHTYFDLFVRRFVFYQPLGVGIFPCVSVHRSWHKTRANELYENGYKFCITQFRRRECVEYVIQHTRRERRVIVIIIFLFGQEKGKYCSKKTESTTKIKFTRQTCKSISAYSAARYAQQ